MVTTLLIAAGILLMISTVPVPRRQSASGEPVTPTVAEPTVGDLLGDLDRYGSVRPGIGNYEGNQQTSAGSPQVSYVPWYQPAKSGGTSSSPATTTQTPYLPWENTGKAGATTSSTSAQTEVKGSYDFSRLFQSPTPLTKMPDVERSVSTAPIVGAVQTAGPVAQASNSFVSASQLSAASAAASYTTTKSPYQLPFLAGSSGGTIKRPPTTTTTSTTTTTTKK